MGEQTPPGKQSWDLESGAAISTGRFVVERLGGGRRYEAYLAWDDRLLTLIVAKILRPDRVDDAGALRALRREAELLARLAHPALVRGFGAVTDGRYPHLLLEHLDGPNLGRLVRRHGPVPLEQLLPVAIAVCAAIHYLHVERVVHLDVKPTNIVVGVQPRLIDLGRCAGRRGGGGAAHADRNGRLHGAGAMRSDRIRRRDRPRRRRLGSRRDALPRRRRRTRVHAPARLYADAPAAARYPQLTGEPPPPLSRAAPPALVELVGAMLAHDPTARPEVAEQLESISDAYPR